MKGEIVPFGPQGSSVDAAWERYVVLARPLVDTPELASNLAHMIALGRAWNEWQQLFLQREPA